jgi:predicted alpha/beta-fold hydrolase
VIIQRLTRLLSVVFVAVFATSALGAANYGYPLTDKYAATVVGTPHDFQADLPKSIPFKRHRITIFPDRKVPDALWYDAEMLYSAAMQDDPAPVVFLIAGTGASHNGSKNFEMARAFYQAGFHVISLSSPTYPNFLVSASSNAVPGHSKHDAEDIYRVMEKVWADLKDDGAQATEFFVTGYSLGGFNTAFVTMLDEERKSFNFTAALLINPPVSLYSSISLLDRMVENIPGGADNFDIFFNKLVRGFSETYKRSNGDFGDDFLYKAYETLDIQDEELAALIGVSFRLSSASLVFASDVMTNFGYVKPKDMPLDRYSDTTAMRRVVGRLGFTDYYHEFFYPFYRDKEGGGERDKFIDEVSLESIADYLRSTNKITVMHNEDDIILEPGQIDFFREVFGDRAKIYPHGGHCGNMSYRDNVDHMVATFAR